MMTRFQGWLDALPTTNWKTFWFVVLVVATFASDAGMMWAVLLWSMQHPDRELRIPSYVEYAHDAWLLFLGAFGGLSFGQFWVKRGTDDPEKHHPPAPTTTTTVEPDRVTIQSAPSPTLPSSEV